MAAAGVSAPAGFGIGLDCVRAVVRAVVGSGTLGLLEVADTGRSLGVDMPVWESYAARQRAQ